MPPAKANPVAERYKNLFDELAKGIDGPVLRLGMGDNFAPDLFARTFGAKIGLPRDPKDRSEWDGHAWVVARPTPAMKAGVSSMPFDNVAQFFIDTHYNALVPGKHDFYFGPERLRDLARLLAADNVHMLAANLVIVTQDSNANPRIPERLRSHEYLTEFGEVAIDLPDIVLPYKREFVIKNARQVLTRVGGDLAREDQLPKPMDGVHYEFQIADPQICWELGPITASNPERVPLPTAQKGNCNRLVLADSICAAPRSASRQSTCKALNPTSSKATADPIFLLEDEDESMQLKAGRNHLFCAKLIDSKRVPAAKFTCQPFMVHTPLFEYGQPISPQKSPERYVKMSSPKPGVVVFGVIDPDVFTNVGLLNFSWLNDNHHLDTTAKVAAPDYSLKQLLEQCHADDDCRSARKILMAQMSYAKAAELISHVSDEFDLVISQADSKHFTGDRTIEAKGEADKFQPQFVLTPPAPYAFSQPPPPSVVATEPPPAMKFTPIVSKAVVTVKPPPANQVSTPPAKVSWNLDHTLTPGEPYVEDRKCDSGPDHPCLSLNLVSDGVFIGSNIEREATGPGAPAGVAPKLSAPLLKLALSVMRKKEGADIAILQKRDLFDAEYLSSQPISYDDVQDQINRIFWKGDFAIRIHVTGAQLKSLMKQSKKFAELDHDALSTEVEMGRSLEILGLFTDPKDPTSFYVNGAKLDEGALYSVAATDYFGLGDTGYTDLATPAVPPAMRLADRDFSHLRSIAGLVCVEIADSYPKPVIQCDRDALDQDYLDQATQEPFDATPGYNTAAHYRTFFKRFLNLPVPGRGSVEGNVQQRAFWSIILESADFNYAATLLRSQSTLSKTFAGVSAQGVTSKGSKNYGEDHKLRAIYDFRVATIYFLSDSSLQRTFTTTSFIPSTASNELGIEGGGTWRLPHGHRLSWFSFQYSGRLEGQMVHPYTSTVSFDPGFVKLNFIDQDKPAPASLLLKPPKGSTVFGRFGGRAEFADTYVEAGFEEIDSRRVLSKYVFGTPAGTISCLPSAQDQFDCSGDPHAMNPAITQQLALAQSGLSAPKMITTDFLTSGLYLNFNVKFPVWSKQDPTGADKSWYFILANKGDFYFNNPANDTSVQTRYLDKLTPSLNFPIFGKFVLSPKVDIIFYENKINRNHFRAVEPTVSLSYSFKWRTGMNFMRAIRYGAITLPPSGGSH
jgi:hypothetical protein